MVTWNKKVQQGKNQDRLDERKMSVGYWQRKEAIKLENRENGLN